MCHLLLKESSYFMRNLMIFTENLTASLNEQPQLILLPIELLLKSWYKLIHFIWAILLNYLTYHLKLLSNHFFLVYNWFLWLTLLLIWILMIIGMFFLTLRSLSVICTNLTCSQSCVHWSFLYFKLKIAMQHFIYLSC